MRSRRNGEKKKKKKNTRTGGWRTRGRPESRPCSHVAVDFQFYVLQGVKREQTRVDGITFGLSQPSIFIK